MIVVPCCVFDFAFLATDMRGVRVRILVITETSLHKYILLADADKVLSLGTHYLLLRLYSLSEVCCTF